MARGTVLVSAVGTETSLGDAVTSFAAARAGLARATPHSGSTYMDRAGDVQALIGHRVPHVHGQQGWPRWMSLALIAMEDLLSRFDTSRLARPVGLFVCLPDPALFPRTVAPAPRGDHLGALFSSRLLAFSGHEERFEQPVVLTRGPTGFVSAVARASELLRSGELSTCIVGAVDSYLDDDTVAWLAGEDRLKTLDQPQGLQPGEAATFLVLERTGQAGQLRSERALELTAATLGRELESGRGPQGAGFLEALCRATADVGRAVKNPWFIADHNGEPERADDLGWLVTRLQSTWRDSVVRPVDLPAAVFGDCGTARGVLGVGWALRAWQRGYFRGEEAIVLVTGDREDRGVLWLRPAS